MSRDSRDEHFRSFCGSLGTLRADLERMSATGGEPLALAGLLDRLRELERAAESLRRATEGEFKHFVHEIRTPLNAIAGWGQIMRDDPITPATVSQAAEVVERNVATIVKTLEAYTG